MPKVSLGAIGLELATLLVREVFVRPIANQRALGSYVGITGTPYSSGGSQREQGISKAGNSRTRAGLLELAWLWRRWRPDSSLSVWFRQCVGDVGAGSKRS
jgi:transposase